MEEIKVNRPVKEFVDNANPNTEQLKSNNTEEIHPEVLYLTIPSDWTCT